MNKERRKRITEALGKISEARDILEEVKDEEPVSYTHLPRTRSPVPIPIIILCVNLTRTER